MYFEYLFYKFKTLQLGGGDIFSFENHFEQFEVGYGCVQRGFTFSCWAP
jgi:hypothetical protein